MRSYSASNAVNLYGFWSIASSLRGIWSQSSVKLVIILCNCCRHECFCKCSTLINGNTGLQRKWSLLTFPSNLISTPHFTIWRKIAHMARPHTAIIIEPPDMDLPDDLIIRHEFSALKVRSPSRPEPLRQSNAGLHFRSQRILHFQWDDGDVTINNALTRPLTQIVAWNTMETLHDLIRRNKRPGCLISRGNKENSKTHQSPSVLRTPPLWKIIRPSPSVLCTPPFEKSLFLVGIYFGLGVYFDKYGNFIVDKRLLRRETMRCFASFRNVFFGKALFPCRNHLYRVTRFPFEQCNHVQIFKNARGPFYN